MTSSNIYLSLPTHPFLTILLLSSLIVISPVSGSRIVDDPYQSSSSPPEEDDNDVEEYDPYDFTVHDVNVMSDYSNKCAPRSWSQWTACNAPNCGEEGISMRKQRSRNCHVEIQQRYCIRTCDGVDDPYQSIIGQSLGEVMADDDEKDDEIKDEQDEDEDLIYVPGQPDRNYFEDDIQREFDELRLMGYSFGNTYRNLEDGTSVLSNTGPSKNNGFQNEEPLSDYFSDSGLTADTYKVNQLGSSEKKWKHYNEYNHDPDGTIDNGFMPHQQNLVTTGYKTDEVSNDDDSENLRGVQSTDDPDKSDKSFFGDSDSEKEVEKKTGEIKSYVSEETLARENGGKNYDQYEDNEDEKYAHGYYAEKKDDYNDVQEDYHYDEKEDGEDDSAEIALSSDDWILEDIVQESNYDLSKDLIINDIDMVQDSSAKKYSDTEKLTEREEVALLAILEGKLEFQESLNGWDVQSLSVPETSGEALSSFSLGSNLGMINGTLGNKKTNTKPNYTNNKRVRTSYKDRCLHLWKSGNTKSGNWTGCCDKMDYRFKLEWVKSPPSGLTCPPKIRKEKCQKKDDCSTCRYGEWGKWRKCSVKCGGGHMSRFRQVITGASMCDEVVETRACSSQPCQCVVSEWSDWSDTCSTECQNAHATDTRSRTRHIVENPGSTTCPDLSETEPCDLADCCKYTEWGDWESCVNSCGDVEGAVQMRHRLLSSVWIKEQCKESLQHVMFDKNIQSECSFRCPTDPKKCYVSDWTEFSSCSSSCGDTDEPPYMTRQRSVLLTAPQLECPPLSETKPCNPPPPICTETCQVTEWSKWSNCDEECGPGTQTRTREVVKTSADERACPKLEERRECDSAVLENVAKTNREFAYKVKLGALTKGSKIVAEGYFSGLNAGVSWINLETDDRDTVFRLALRYDGRVENMEIVAQKKIVISTIYDKAWKFIPPYVDMPDFAPGNMTFTISVQDTFEVDVTCGVNKVLNIKSNVGTANSTRISRIALRRTYPQTLLWNRDLKLIEQQCVAVDCVVSEWGEWTVVQNRRARRRHVIVKPNTLGEQCPPLIESEECTYSTCPAEDCQVSHWSDWSECQVSCLSEGMDEKRVYQTRTRSITVQPDKEGEKCPSLMEQRPCDPKPPACNIDCEVGEWGEWDFLTTEKGSAIRQRSRKITVEPENGGKRCPALTESEECTYSTCPAEDCQVSHWSGWSDCKVSCLSEEMDEKKVYQTRLRSITVQPDKRGQKCPSLMEQRPCDPKPPACNIDCKVGDWGDWEFATIEKGAVIQERSREITVESRNGGKKCPSLIEFQDCSEVRCKLDCKLSEWTEYGECSGTCISGDIIPVRKRHMTVLVEPKNGGKNCGTLPEETQKCEQLPKCEEKCPNAEWTEWSACDKECGFGEKTRTRMKKKNSGECVERKDTKKCYLERCKKEKDDCEIGLWADWSSCTPECGSSRKRSRKRNVTMNRRDAICPPDTQTLPCQKIECDKKACPVSEWSEWKPCDCETKKSASERVIEKQGTCKKIIRRRNCEDEECQKRR
ncbi:hypothetical protein ACHWQZ_G016220 [Mnemiopsis leidyi]